jgi:hypothetical protein
MNDTQILGDAADGRRLRPKPKQLRMMSVSLRPARQNGLRKQRFPPQGNEPASVEILRV